MIIELNNHYFNLDKADHFEISLKHFPPRKEWLILFKYNFTEIELDSMSSDKAPVKLLDKYEKELKRQVLGFSNGE